MTKIIKLTKGKSVVIDESDYLGLSKYRWFFDGKYACRMLPTVNGKRSKIRMHHQVIGRKKDKQVDHINLNKLDNRRSNLRICTASENSQNRPVRIDNKSGISGVYWNNQAGKWQAYIGIDRELIHLGLFEDKKGAIEARREAQIKYHPIFYYEK